MTSFLADDGPRAFVIVSSARSGSNLLVRYLRQVQGAACFGEIFRDGFVGSGGWRKLVARLDLSSDATAMHAEDLTAFWEYVLARALRRRRWAGAKVFYYHRREDPVWDRFREADHRVIHLWRDATFDQYVSRLLAGETGEWKGEGAATPDEEARVTFDVDDYVGYRSQLRAHIEATRAEHVGSDRYVEIEYRQLIDHVFVASLLDGLFGERIDVREMLRQQRPRPKTEYLTNPEVAAPFVADSISRGFSDDPLPRHAQ